MILGFKKKTVFSCCFLLKKEEENDYLTDQISNNQAHKQNKRSHYSLS